MNSSNMRIRQFYRSKMIYLYLFVVNRQQRRYFLLECFFFPLGINIRQQERTLNFASANSARTNVIAGSKKRSTAGHLHSIRRYTMNKKIIGSILIDVNLLNKQLATPIEASNKLFLFILFLHIYCVYIFVFFFYITSLYIFSVLSFSFLNPQHL